MEKWNNSSMKVSDLKKEENTLIQERSTGSIENSPITKEMLGVTCGLKPLFIMLAQR